MSDPKIVSARVGPMPKSFMDPMPKVVVTLEDGTIETLFDFYPDELSFREAEFIGLTAAEGKRLKFEKDRRFLQT